MSGSYFEKWHACKNDFLVVWTDFANDEFLTAALKKRAVSLCARVGDGIGADGILVLHGNSHSKSLPTRMTIINSDGSIARNCGNGLRCAAASLAQKQLREKQEVSDFFELQVEGQKFVMKTIPGRVPSFVVEMPLLSVQKEENSEVQAWLKERFKIESAYQVSVANPHLVVFGQFKNVVAKEIAELQKFYADGINVHLVQSQDLDTNQINRIREKFGYSPEVAFSAYVWERGAGPTAACGSGACAIVAAARKDGLAAVGEWNLIGLPGGNLLACQRDDSTLELTGPTERIFQGELEI